MERIERLDQEITREEMLKLIEKLRATLSAREYLVLQRAAVTPTIDTGIHTPREILDRLRSQISVTKTPLGWHVDIGDKEIEFDISSAANNSPLERSYFK